MSTKYDSSSEREVRQVKVSYPSGYNMATTSGTIHAAPVGGAA